MITRKNAPLLIALAIPVLMIALISAFIYLPGLGKKPKVNFVYMTGNGFYPGSLDGNYYIRDGQLMYDPPLRVQEGLAPYYIPPKAFPPRFYLYDVSSNMSTEISLNSAKAYNLDASLESTDGYTVVRGNYRGGDIFFGGSSYDYNSMFIQGHNRSKKLNINLSSTDYYDFKFLGWVK